jgi:hypothetical protein
MNRALQQGLLIAYDVGEPNLISLKPSAKGRNSISQPEVACARGAVVQKDFKKALATPFPAFPEWSQLNEAQQRELLNQPCELTPKYDGSLGVGFWYNKQFFIVGKSGYDTLTYRHVGANRLGPTLGSRPPRPPPSQGRLDLPI